MTISIPEGWVSVKIIDFATLMYGKGLPIKKLTEKGYPVYGANGIIGKYTDYLFENPQVIISCRGAASGAIHITKEFSFVTSNSIIILRVLDYIDLFFLKYALISVNKDNIITGTAQPQITIANLKNLKIPLPPLAEQKRIVAKLDALMGHIERSKERLAKVPALLKAFRQSVLAQAVSGKLTEYWREGNADVGEWQILSSSDLFTFITSGSRGWAKYYDSEGEQLFVRITNMSYETFQLDLRVEKCQFLSLPNNSEGKRTLLQPRDILISITADVGMIALIPDDWSYEAYVNQHVCLARPIEEINESYLCLFLMSKAGFGQLDNLKRGATKVGLTLGNIRSLNISTPPLQEQQEIVKQVEALFSKADAIEAQYQAAMQHLETLPQAVLAKAFRGELVEQDAQEEPASVLLERIQAAQAALVVEKKKKGKKSRKK